MNKPRSFVILCQYGSQREAESVRRLQKLASRLLPHTSPVILVLDNAEKIDYEQQLFDSLIKVSGDNDTREFSAYDKGLKLLRRDFPFSDKDPVIIANDTFYTNYGDAYLKKFTASNVASTLEKNGIIGHVDAYPKPVSLFDLNLQSWIRSSFLVTNLGVLNRIGHFALPFRDEEVFSSNKETFFTDSTPLSPNYKQYIKSWLFDDQPPIDNFSQTWHSKAALSESNFESFKAKAKCILSEHYFSARAQKLEIPLVQV